MKKGGKQSSKKNNYPKKDMGAKFCGKMCDHNTNSSKRGNSTMLRPQSK